MALPLFLLLTDDALAIFLVTYIGLKFHSLDAILMDRLPYTFLPFLLAWVSAAVALRLYRPSVAGQWKQLWRVPLAALLAAVPAAALRALWLDIPFTPLFALIMGLVLAGALLITRSLYIATVGRLWLDRG
ncbi:MAG: DUF3054 family protein [Anaerolineales bacterium]|nr:DUF3054 family protein [Anaerolineales bacterium]MCW5856508.1 DUF3054 family protein [Anaerolineales bacterium]